MRPPPAAALIIHAPNSLFSITDLKPHSPEFVRSWTVERYQIDLHKAAKLNQDDMQAQIKILCSLTAGSRSAWPFWPC